MRNRLDSIIMLAKGCLLALTSTSYAANTAEPVQSPQWYEVNIVIFKLNSPDFQTEQWRDREQLKLQFPLRTALLDDDSYDNIDFSNIVLEPFIADATAGDTTGGTTGNTRDDITGAISIYEPQPRVPSPTKPPAKQTAPTVSSDYSEDIQEILAAQETTAFRSLTTEDEEFKQALRRLRNSKHYKILTTKTWRQPGLAPKESIPVLIQAGEEFDGNFELEGTVSVSLSRYLHVQSNLWLSEYVKQIELSNTWWEQSTFENAPEFGGVLTDSTLSQLSDTEIIPESGSETELENKLEAELETPLLSSLSGEETTTHYEAIRTVILDESRRMRSNEFHYLDHPLFGMVIKVTPYDIPAPVEPKSEEASTSMESASEATVSPPTTLSPQPMDNTP